MPAPHERLAPGELQVLLQLARGRTASQIARETGRSVKTVCGQKYRALDKLGLETSADLTAYALAHGLLQNWIVPEVSRG